MPALDAEQRRDAAGAVLGLGGNDDLLIFGAAAEKLPAGDYRISGDPGVAGNFPALGFALGAYAYADFKPSRKKPAARLLAPVLELEGRFPVRVTVPPMSTRQLASMLELRHRLSGYALGFRHHTPSLHEWVRSPTAAWRTRRRTGAATLERLSLLSAGNVRQALRLWLAAARLEDGDVADDGEGPMRRAAGRVVVGPLAALPDALVDELPLISRLLLAALLLHGPLRRDELSAVTLRQGHALDAEITHLVHLGFLSLQTDPPGPHGEREPLVQVNTRLVAPLTQELRACNLL